MSETFVCRQSPVRLSDCFDVYRLFSFGSVFELERNFFPFVQCFKRIGDDSRIVDENIFPVLSGNESVALLVVEPFDPAYHINLCLVVEYADKGTQKVLIPKIFLRLF